MDVGAGQHRDDVVHVGHREVVVGPVVEPDRVLYVDLQAVGLQRGDDVGPDVGLGRAARHVHGLADALHVRERPIGAERVGGSGGARGRRRLHGDDAEPRERGEHDETEETRDAAGADGRNHEHILSACGGRVTRQKLRTRTNVTNSALLAAGLGDHRCIGLSGRGSMERDG